MQKEEVMVLAHLLTAIKEAVRKLEEAQKRRDNGGIMDAKREILVLQGQIKRLL